MVRWLPRCAFSMLLAATPAPLWAASSAPGHGEVVRLFFVLAVMLLAGKFAGEAFERFGQPAVLGELVAGAVLGAGLLGVIPTDPADPLSGIIRLLGEVGVAVLLFEIGLETDLKQMFRVGLASSSVALAGVAVPFALGYGLWVSPFMAGDPITATFIGATLTATSVGITARVLNDLGVMRSLEARLVLGAAVIDDVLGLVLLGLVSKLVAGSAITAWGVTRTLGVAIGFLLVAVTAGLKLAPWLFGLVDRMRVRGVLLVSAFAFTLLFAALADVAGSAMIIGAFAAGIVLSGTNQFRAIEERMKPVADLFTPLFFLGVGAAFDARVLDPSVAANRPVLGLSAALLVAAVLGKVVAGWAVPWIKFNRIAVGIGMMPRGEVGLIFANIGLTAGVLSPPLFSAVVLVVIVTTFLAPPLLKWTFARGAADAAAPPPSDVAL